jgi:hypothetical protein
VFSWRFIEEDFIFISEKREDISLWHMGGIGRFPLELDASSFFLLRVVYWLLSLASFQVVVPWLGVTFGW